MHVQCRNVNDAFRDLVSLFHTGEYSTSYWTSEPTITRKPSRVGEVLTIEGPVTVTYTHPRERVLFNPARDANPFFHLYEALWMLSGRDDIAGPAYYSSGYAAQVQDGDSDHANGAYGFRWRRTGSVVAAFGAEELDAPPGWKSEPIDQLDRIVEHLRFDPNSRRAVLQMWQVGNDLLKVGYACPLCDGGKVMSFAPCGRCGGVGRVDYSKDVCCNLNVMFSLREGANPRGGVGAYRVGDKVVNPPRVLDMTVTNRSNDLVWGMLGANYVHFTVLQEYMAARLGAEVGLYHQVTNNLHVYTERFRPLEWLEAQGEYAAVSYADAQPLVSDPAAFEQEVKALVERHSRDAMAGHYNEPFLRLTAQPMFIAFHYHKRRDYEAALEVAGKVEDVAWRTAAVQWLKRRAEKHGKSNP